MALIDARILRSIRISESKADKGSIQRSASQDFLIIADEKDPPFNDILEDTTTWPNLGNAKLPQIDDEITVKGVSLFVTSRELSYYKDNERAVVMAVKYDSKALPEPEKPENTDPETWKRISISSQSITKPAQGWTDLADVPGLFAEDKGDGAKNSAKEPVDGLEEEASLVRLSYTNTQVANPDFYQLLGHVNSCNSNAFLGANPYCIRVAGVSGEYDQKNNTWSITVEFVYNPDGWEISFYDAGYNEIVNNERRAILDKAGNPVGNPVPLDGNGVALAIGSNPLKRFLYPYPKTDLTQIFTTCRI
jgi:hypothetical protein